MRLKYVTVLILCLAVCWVGCKKHVSPAPGSEWKTKFDMVEWEIINDIDVNKYDLTDITADQLKLLRNTVFARHGRKYDSPGMGDYFKTKTWYAPKDTYNDNDLTARDQQNLKLIQATELAMKNGKQSPDASSTQPTVQANIEEAVKTLQARYEECWTQCGEDYFSIDGGEVKEYKGMTYSFISESPITEAEKLNGTEWSGTVRLSVRAIRQATIGRGGWRSWINGFNMDNPIVKQGGKWYAPTVFNGCVDRFKVKCGDPRLTQ